MARIRVFAAAANPAADQPASYCSKSRAARLIRTAAAVLIASRTIQLLAIRQAQPLSHNAIEAVGYDHAVGQGAAPSFTEVWEMKDSAGVQMWQYTANRDRRPKEERV